MLRSLILAIALLFASTALPSQEAKAIDPVTIAILAPIAIKAAQVVLPYVIRGLTNAGTELVKFGVATVKLFLIPWGALEMVFGLPFGYFGQGLKHVFTGLWQPFMMVWHIVMVPIQLFNVF